MKVGNKKTDQWWPYTLLNNYIDEISNKLNLTWIMSLSWDVGSISAVSRARSLMSAGSFSRTAAGNRAYEMQSFVLLKVNPYMLSILIFLFFWFCFVSKCFIFDGELLDGSKNLCLVVCQKNYIWENEPKTNFFSVVLHIKVIQKAFKLTFFKMPIQKYLP